MASAPPHRSWKSGRRIARGGPRRRGAAAWSITASLCALSLGVADAPAKSRSAVLGAKPRTITLTNAAPARAVVDRASARRCGRRGVRLSVVAHDQRLIRATVGSRPRRLRSEGRLAPGTHRLTLRSSARGRCRIRLDGLALKAAPAGPPILPDPLTAPKRRVPLGAAVDKRSQFMWPDAAYTSVFLAHYDGLTPENVLKPEYTWTGDGQYSFERADEVVGFAATNGRSVHGHVLIWHKQNPRWLTGRRWEAAELTGRVADYMRNVMGHYRETIREWDVINEPLSDQGPGLRESFWLDNLGPGYIEQAFRLAHEANPDARLFLNEFGIETPGPKADALYALVADLRRRGVPIHGVGFQFHLDEGAPVSALDTLRQLRRFADLGVEVQITEMDVAINPPEALLHEHRENQRRQFENVALACNALPACTRFTVWGVADRYTWRGAGTTPLLLDEEYRRKPAYDSVLAAFAPRG